MKKLLFIGILFIYGISNSQEYIPMFQEDNVWGVRYFDIYQGVEYLQFNIGETEIINDKEYKRIYIDSAPLDCYIREENGIIYLFDSSSIEKIIMNFNLEVNDTFEAPHISCFSGPQQNFTVLSISTQYIAGMERKVLEVVGWTDPHFWIEGLGSTLGGLYVGESNIEGGSSLSCFYTNGETYFFNDAEECNITLNLSDFTLDEITIYPNPVNEISILQLPIEAEIDQIIIYNINGQIINNESITKEYFKIDAMNYASGMYLYQVLSKGNIIKANQFIVK